MNTAIRYLFSVIALLSVAVAAQSETTYITDELRAGLHEGRDLDSPIIKILSTGTQLEVLRREDSLSYVKDPDGVTGWIGNSYLTKEITTTARLKSALNKNLALEKQVSQLRQELKSVKTDNAARQSQDFTELEKEHKNLQQQHRSAQLEIEKLQKQLEKVKTRAGQGNNDDSVYQQLEQLQQEKEQLENHLASLLDNKLGVESVQSTALAADNNQGAGGHLYYILAVILGFGGGIVLMDYLNRRRHGGFRV